MKPVLNSTDFDFPSVTKSEGYLIVDHRNSPGLPEEVARKVGYIPDLCKEGKVFEAAVVACGHCLGVLMKKPGDMVARCLTHGYICDACVIASKHPAYVHRGRQEIIDLVQSGKYIVSGSTSLPVLTRKEHTNG